MDGEHLCEYLKQLAAKAVDVPPQNPQQRLISPLAIFGLIKGVAQHHEGGRIELGEAPVGLRDDAREATGEVLWPKLAHRPSDVREVLWRALVHLLQGLPAEAPQELGVVTIAEPCEGPNKVGEVLRGEVVEVPPRHAPGSGKEAVVPVATCGASPKHLDEVLWDEALDLGGGGGAEALEGHICLVRELRQAPRDEGDVEGLKLVGTSDDSAKRHAQKLVDTGVVLVGHGGYRPDHCCDILPRKAAHHLHGPPSDVGHEVRIIVSARGQTPSYH
mmetsp:Transcript_70817/g.159056  ORF Transcript_70817/g.159056 Transcript_70817/m.159056 type:complete len:274 (-) Transcript_70817:145-966(-)